MNAPRLIPGNCCRPDGRIGLVCCHHACAEVSSAPRRPHAPRSPSRWTTCRAAAVRPGVQSHRTPLFRQAKHDLTREPRRRKALRARQGSSSKSTRLCRGTFCAPLSARRCALIGVSATPEAQALMQQTLPHRNIYLTVESQKLDADGNLPVYAVLDNGNSLNEGLISGGLAGVYTACPLLCTLGLPAQAGRSPGGKAGNLGRRRQGRVIASERGKCERLRGEQDNGDGQGCPTQRADAG